MTLQYFAWVRERMGCDGETITLPENISTVGALLDHLVAKGAPYSEAFAERVFIKSAVNERFADADTKITDSDDIAFFPPVTGG